MVKKKDMNISEAGRVPKRGVIVNSHGLNLLPKKGVLGHDFFARGNGKLNKFDRELQAETKKKPKQQNRLISSFGFYELTENLSVFCNHLLKHQYLLPVQNCLVTPKGLEPPTNRTGICHSIQLNYGANQGAKITILPY